MRGFVAGKLRSNDPVGTTSGRPRSLYTVLYVGGRQPAARNSGILYCTRGLCVDYKNKRIDDHK
jgi:hypothetical protein